MHTLTTLFKDLKIIEFASALAGPQAATLFKELGAAVLKVEAPGGDVTRKWRLPTEPITSKNTFYYCSVNGQKESKQLDLKSQEDATHAKILIAEADVIITNFTNEKAAKYGLTYLHLKQIKSDIILANVTGFGGEIDRPAFDVLVQAESGLISMTGYPGQPPARIPIPIVDILAAHQLKEGILCALLKKMQTGKGCEIQVSLYDSALSALANPASNYLMGGQIAHRLGSQHASIAPYGDLYTTKDDHLIIMAIGSDRQFSRLCQAINAMYLTTDPRFVDNDARVRNRDHLSVQLSKIFAEKSKDQWTKIFLAHHIPAGCVENIGEVLSSNQAQENIVEELLDDKTICRRMRQAVFI